MNFKFAVNEKIRVSYANGKVYEGIVDGRIESHRPFIRIELDGTTTAEYRTLTKEKILKIERM